MIFLSLKAIAADPALWNRLHEPSGEFLLLTEEDFKNPAGSTGLQTLLAHPDRTVSGLADQVRSLAFQPLDLLPPLARAVPAQRSSATAATTASAGSASASGAGGLPSWMPGHLAAPPASAPVASATASPGCFRIRTPLDVVVAVLWPMALVAFVVLAAAGMPTAVPGSVAPLCLAAAVTAFARSRRAERVQSGAALAALTHQLGRAEDPAKAAAKLREERTKFDAAETERNAAYAQAQDELTAQYHAALNETEERRVRKQRDIDKKLDGLAEKLRKALDRALTEKQSAYVRDQLGRRLISQSPPHGIGPKLAARLAAHGIRSAADFTGYRAVYNSPYSSTGAVLVLPGGRRINIHGIGEAKAIALETWRSNAVRSAVARQPAALSAPERQSIEQGIARRRAQLTDQRKAAETEADSSRAQAKKRLEEGRERLARKHTAAGDRARQQRLEFSRRTVELQQNNALHATLSAAVDAARIQRSGLSYVRYLRFLYFGR
ncbi:hypothetical protein [Streptomyces sp. MST-110588]|uniref:hypothetical protein n=1 Tax=Streptomyces sp. MST-110588 TaxID=2833628 RepID=UPI001F5E0B87|nr:hypothetical protein [Streptomyces sp. MST-110588]UNO39476.1 hypothetical protein KGS77_07485 [Streptomyces sp. MST-110588]